MFKSNPNASASGISPPLKYHGGKGYLAPRIWDLIRARGHRHTNYVEPYLGGGAVLLARPDSIQPASEVVNDIDGDLTNFWRVLQGGDSFGAFHRLCEATPFSEAEWSDADMEFRDWPEHDANATNTVVRAWRFFVRCRMSLAGRMKSFTGVTKTRTRRGMNGEVSAWLTAVDGLPLVHARLRQVMVINRPALTVIRQFDSHDTLFYLDPPYVHATRATTTDYRHEMTEADHVEMLEALVRLRGKFVLSGYATQLYDAYSTREGWHRAEWDMPNNAAGGTTKRRMTEVVWMNF
jgi:DNA adenine methylase